MKRNWQWMLAIGVAVAAIFVRAAAFEYIRLDDQDYTFLCPFLKDGLSFHSIISAFSAFTYAAIWMPLTYLSYAVDITLASLLKPLVTAPMIHHFGNVLFHAANATLVFIFFRREISKGAFAEEAEPSHYEFLLPALAALMWAMSPLRVEPVCWIAGRKELLWTFFALLGVLFWQRHHFLLATVFAVLACLSKPTAMCMPLLFLLIDYARFRGTKIKEFLLSPNFHARLRAFLMLAIIAVFTAIIAAWSQTHAAGYAEKKLFAAPLWWRLVNGLNAVGNYVVGSFGFGPIHIDHRAMSGALPVELKTGLVGIAILVVAAVICRRRKGFWFGLLFAGAALMPTLGLFGSFGRESLAARFAYFPSIMIFLIFAYPWKWCGRRCQLVVVGAILVALTARTWFLIGDWRNDWTVFKAVLRHDETHPRALAHVGSEECARFHRFDEGIEYFRKSLAAEESFDVAAQLALALANRAAPGDHEELLLLAADLVSGERKDEKGFMLLALGIDAAKRGDRAAADRWIKAAMAAPRRQWTLPTQR